MDHTLDNTVSYNQETGYTISDVQLALLAQTYGTPLYVYDGERIETRHQLLRESIDWPKVKIYYAMKANYNPAILKLMNGLGIGIDAVSPAEVLLAERLGFEQERILFTSNNITDREMEKVHEANVLFNIGSLSRLEKYGRAYPGSRVCLRFNPMVVAGEHETIQTGGEKTKFGIPLDDIDRVRTIIKEHDLHVVGLHKHTGSGIADTEKFMESIRNLLSVATKENFPELEFIDIGGGMKVPYEPDEKRIDYPAFGKELGELFSNFCNDYGRELELLLEPGKYLVAECGMLLVTVNTLKEQFGRRIAGTDSGFPHLIRPVLYDAYHHIINVSNPGGAEHAYDIVGNICESGDIFADQRPLPEVREGDVLAILNAGAYCYAMASPYNLRPLPAEVFVYQDKHAQVTQHLSEEQLVDRISRGVTP